MNEDLLITSFMIVMVCVSLYWFSKPFKIVTAFFAIRSKGFQTQGEIVDFHVDGYSDIYTPIVRFCTADGINIEAKALFSSPKRQLAEIVELRYNPKKPKSFYINPAPSPFIHLLFLIIAVGLCIITLSFLYVRLTGDM